MTKNKKAKRAARALKAATGRSYTAARRAASKNPASDDQRREEPLAPYLRDAVDKLASEPVSAVGGIELPESLLLHEATVEEIAVT